MAQSKVTGPEDIYNALSGDGTFMSFIGQYKFLNDNAVKNAISILTPGENLPNIESITGVEAIIHDVGDISRRDYLTSASDALIEYRVFLLLWDPGSGNNLTGAASRAVEMFTGATAIETVATPKELNALVQTLVRIPGGASIAV